MKSPKTHPPTLIFDGTGRTVTTLARSLAKQGLDVHWAYFHPRPWADVPSRALLSRHPLPDFRKESELFRNEILRLVQRYSIRWIIPASDAALTALLPLYEQLSQTVQLNFPSPEKVCQVLDKGQTLAIAAECGIPCPREFRLDITPLVLPTDMAFPLVAKPLSKRSATQEAVLYFYSFAELEAACVTNPALVEQYLFQEYCPGSGVGIETLFHQGNPVVLFQHRRIKELPYTGGVSVVAEAEALDPRLASMAVSLLQRLGWEGVAMVEFRHDPVGGRTALMEINGRYWGSLPLAQIAGLDFPALQLQLYRGLPAIAPVYRTGVRMRSTATAISRILGIVAAWRRRTVSMGFLLRECAGFIGDFGPRTYDALFSWSDPRPAMEELLFFVRLGLRRIKVILPRSWRNILSLGSQEGFRAAIQMGRLSWQRRSGAPVQADLPPTVRSILFFCSGNIIRSPFSEYLLRRVAGDSLQIASAGLHAALGRPADARAVAVALSGFHINLEEHRAQPLTDTLIERFDLVIGMDWPNAAIFADRHPAALYKFRLLGDLGLDGQTIPDPYSGSAKDIEICYINIVKAIEGLHRHLQAQTSSPC